MSKMPAADPHAGHDMSKMSGRGPTPAGYSHVMLDAVPFPELGFSTAKVERRKLARRLRTTGWVTVDETQTSHVHAKVRGVVAASPWPLRGLEREEGRGARRPVQRGHPRRRPSSCSRWCSSDRRSRPRARGAVGQSARSGGRSRAQALRPLGRVGGAGREGREDRQARSRRDPHRAARRRHPRARRHRRHVRGAGHRPVRDLRREQALDRVRRLRARHAVRRDRPGGDLPLRRDDPRARRQGLLSVADHRSGARRRARGRASTTRQGRCARARSPASS